LGLTHIRIRALTLAADQSLSEWMSEASIPQRIQWMVRGPWRHADIDRWISWEGLQHLERLSPRLEPERNPYSAEARLTPADLAYEIEVETQWVPWQAPAEQPPDWPALALSIEDSLGLRSLQVVQTLVVLGAEKVLQAADGQKIRLQDQCPVPWQNETAWFIAVTAQHVSGLHLLVRRQEQDILFCDPGSTNGTYLQGQRLQTGQWHRLEQSQTLFLGGPQTDSRTLSAGIHLRLGQTVQAVATQRTPLRVATPLAAELPPLLRMLLTSEPAMDSWVILSLPFVVGRDVICDGVVPAHHEMVSRRHVVIEAIDHGSQQVKLRDISRHGLTQSARGWVGSPTEGVWVALGDTITLGKANGQRGFSFRLMPPSLHKRT
jgi:pSer/pThr/pTyr-binding forkhead associated (FHA) protein